MPGSALQADLDQCHTATCIDSTKPTVVSRPSQQSNLEVRTIARFRRFRLLATGECLRSRDAGCMELHHSWMPSEISDP
jgi:hypothetical protein